jgi:hypothetical protein
LSNTAWAFAKLGFSSPVLFEALAEAAVGKLDAFTAQGLSNTAWAYATMGHYHPALVQQLAEQVGDGRSQDARVGGCGASLHHHSVAVVCEKRKLCIIVLHASITHHERRSALRYQWCNAS